MNHKIYCTRIKSLRNEQKLSQEKVAVKLGISREKYNKLENGHQKFEFDDIFMLCKLFDCDIGYLMGEYDTKKHIVADVCSVTGLSEKAVYILNSYKVKGNKSIHDNLVLRHYNSDFYSDIINKFIENHALTANLLNYYKKQVKITYIKSKSTKSAEFIEFDEESAPIEDLQVADIFYSELNFRKYMDSIIDDLTSEEIKSIVTGEKK